MSTVEAPNGDPAIPQIKAESSPSPPHLLIDMEERVNELERIREVGFGLLNLVEQHLNENPKDDEVASWCNRLESLRCAPRSPQTLIGILGETGVGKSTKINSMLDERISPTSESEACTAAPCVFSFNEDNDPAHAFSAMIIFKSRETVERELDALLEEYESISEFDNEPAQTRDPELVARKHHVNEQLKIVHVWSGIPVAGIIKASSACDVISRSNSDILGILHSGNDETHKTIRWIHSKEASKFQPSLKEYIDGSSRNKKGKYWPLVELVEVFVKADILRHGVKLVDLPGIMDSLESRSRVARDFTSRLDRRIVVTPAARAADNKSASELILPSEHAMDMEIDGKFCADSLAVAITKIDDIFCGDPEAEWPDNLEIQNAAEDLGSTEERLAQMSDKIKRVREEIRGLRLEDGDHSSSDSDEDSEDEANGATQTGLKRLRPCKSEGESIETKKRRKVAEKRLQKLQRSQWKLELKVEELKSRMTELCVQARNHELVERISQHIRSQKDQIGSESKATLASDNIASVFPISSRAHQLLTHGDALRGFPSIESTGIAALKNWIIQGSLSQRVESALADIRQIQVLFDVVDGLFLQEGPMELQLPLSQKQPTTNALKRHVSDLDTNMEKNRLRLRKNLSNLKPMRNTHLAMRNRTEKGSEDGTIKAKANMDRAVTRWNFKDAMASEAAPQKGTMLHWATYAACVRRNGGVFSTTTWPRTRYHWMSTIVRGFWRGHINHWDSEMNRKVHRLSEQACGTARLNFDAFVEKLCSDTNLPESFRELLRRDVYKMEHVIEAYQAGIMEKYSDLRRVGMEAKLTVEQGLLKRMRPGFELAKQERGKNILKRQSQIVETHVTSVSEDAIKSVRDTVEGKLYGATRKMSKDILNLWPNNNATSGNGGGRRLWTHLQWLADNAFRPKNNASQSAIKAKGKTNPAVRQIVFNWRAQWEEVHTRLPKQPELKYFED